MSTVEEAYSRGQEPSQGNTSPTATGKRTGRASAAGRGRPVRLGRGTASAGVCRIGDQYPDPNGQHTGFMAALL